MSPTIDNDVSEVRYENSTEMTTLSKIIEYNDMQRILAEFSRLEDRCYLENAGATLYPQSLLQLVYDDLTKNVYMNPHTDKYTKDCIDQIRYLTLQHFNADPSKYTVVFTAGTTQSLKLVVESFEFASNPHDILNCGSFVYLRDNHTSILGLREIAAEKNADIIHIKHDDFMKYLSESEDSPPAESQGKCKNEGNTLLAYPAQSNFNGYKYPVNCIKRIKDGCLNNYLKKHLCKINCNWYVLLDAASFVPTNKLDLSVTEPDFVCLSYYKIFGYPTGLGALLLKNSSAHILSQKKYFGGGTVDIVLSSEDYHVKRQNLQERFEDGTQAFIAIIALKHCFDLMNKLIPKVIKDNVMDTISHHTFYLAQDLYQQLVALEHKNGVKAAVLYLDSNFEDIKTQGGIVTFNLLREDKTYIGYSEFQHMADLFDIHVRTGCFCNSGSCQRHLHATNKEMKDMYNAGHKCGDDFDLIEGRPTGAIRASFSYYNTYRDVDNLMKMIYRCFVRSKFKKPLRRMISIAKKNDIKPIKPIETLVKESPLQRRRELNKLRPVENSVEQNTAVLTEMVIYPIKSCGPFKIASSWKIGQKGFEYDREWMIIKENGVCLTQKHTPQMCLIYPSIDLKNKLLILNFKGKSTIKIPLNPESEEKEAVYCQTKVCTDRVKGCDCGDQVADWISEALGISYLRLIKQSNLDTRAKKRGELKLNLSNQAQFLLINKATVQWLSDKITDPQFTDTIQHLIDRFRGNLTVNMEEPWVEKDWKRLIIGKHEFRVEGSCTRCQMVCINQQTGTKTVEPLRTISESLGGKLQFGIYLSYIGPIDGSKDLVLKRYSPVKPFSTTEDNIRFNKWFLKYFVGLTDCSYSMNS